MRHVLACGSGTYLDAIVASTSPFILVSGAGDMVWSTRSPEQFIRFDRAATRNELSAVLARIFRDNNLRKEIPGAAVQQLESIKALLRSNADITDNKG